MKRYFILCLLLALLLPCMVVPASATTQGVIDAIEDLQAGLGTSQRDIVDLLTSIDEWIYECYTQLADIASTVYGSIYENYCVPLLELMSPLSDSVTNIKNTLGNIYKYFFTKNTSVKYYYIGVSGGKLNLLYNGPATVTGFQADLVGLENGLYSGFYRALDAIYQLLLGDTSISDAVQDEVNQDSTEASEYLDIIDDVTKPDEGELENLADISGYVDSSDVTALADVFKPLFESAVFLPCIMLNLTFMLVGYVLFGKR